MSRVRGDGSPTVTEHVVAAALASLPQVGPQRLRVLVNELGASDAWRIIRGELPPTPRIAALFAQHDLGRVWRQAATDQLLEQIAESLTTSGMSVRLLSDAEYPEALRGDPSAPAVLFVRGNITALRHRRVGVVGTRAASAAGRHFARRLSCELAANGVAVVSGLARGIDAAAHLGALDALDAAPPIAVVASGLDVVYPREHAALWGSVAEHGVVLSESPPGCAPDAFRFPLRNRILAALSEVLVVVESRETGGSMITVEEALKRGVTVMAVPGAPLSSTSAGTNQLLSQGAAPVRDATDVLVALGLDHERHRSHRETRIAPSPEDRVVLNALLQQPLTFDQLVQRVGLPIQDVAIRIGHLETQGWITANAGWWEALVTS
jgi:DNA processing protein